MAISQSEIEYLGMSGWQKFCHNFVAFFKGLPRAFLRVFTVYIPKLARKIWNSAKNFFLTLYNAARYGDWKTRTSFGIMGFSQLANKQIMRGLLFLVFELLFIVYMVCFGGAQLSLFGSLGVKDFQPSQVVDGHRIPAQQGDNSQLILLYGILTIIFIIAFAYAWYSNIKAAYAVQQYVEANQHLTTAKEDMASLADAQYHKTLLVGPLIGLTIFTILPIIFMIFVGFTNYDVDHSPPGARFQWIGWDNFRALFSGGISGGSIQFGRVFGQLLLWTVIWAVFATFSNYILGMIIAIMINKKGIKLKKLWRTVLIMTIAVPQFVSLLLMSNMLGDNGIVNKLFQNWGLISSPIKFLSDKYLVKVTIIVVNMWIGIPYTMLMVSGILMNIPADLYESARIDGAGPVKMYMKITLPYVWHVTTPSLITTFTGNLNNFGVIYLLSGGGPSMTAAYSGGAGESDLLITWLFKLVTEKQAYGMASVISIMMFVLTAVVSVITFNRSKAVQNEEDFM